MPLVLFLFLFLCAFPASAQEPAWFLLAHDDGCVDLKLLAKAETLPRVPVSPKDYAGMMRERGTSVSSGLPDGFLPELQGKVVQVSVGNGSAPTFVTKELCDTLDKGR